MCRFCMAIEASELLKADEKNAIMWEQNLAFTPDQKALALRLESGSVDSTTASESD